MAAAVIIARSKDTSLKNQKKRKEDQASLEEKTDESAVRAGIFDVDKISRMEDIRDLMIKDMQEEIRLEQYDKKRRIEMEAEEAMIRQRQLKQTRVILSRHWTAYANNILNLKQEENWARYMTCDGLPDPGSLSDMNTFLFLWPLTDKEASMNTIEDKCRVITHLLSKIDRIIRFSTIDSKEYVIECESIATKLRIELQRWIDLACYRLLRNIEANMIREDMKTTRYVRATNKAVCCVWAPIPLPIGLKRQGGDIERSSLTAHGKSIEIEFKEMKLTIKMPSDLDCHRMAIRGLWLAYDHYSIEANSYRMPQLPENLFDLWNPSLDLLEYSTREYEEKVRLREEQAEGRRLRLEEKKAILERMEYPPVSPRLDKRRKRGKKEKKAHSAKDYQLEFESTLASVLPSKTELLPYLPTPNEILDQKEEEAMSESRKLLFTRCEKTEVNLRKYRILGGVFRVDLLYQPPQPKDLGKETYLTTLELPKEPKFVQFLRSYETPKAPLESERTPEVIEAEMKALELAMDALVLLTLKLPDSVFWFEPPVVAHWLPEKEMWSTKHVHDVKFNEEKQTITFRTGRLGIHGLAGYKYANLPFQSWELKPEMGKSGREHAGVVLNITAATIQAEFVVREDRVCLNSLTGAASTPIKEIIGEYFELECLIERLQQVGCDLFPERDAASYLKGLSIKHPIAEKHLRECMALLSTSYIFSWSRWNASRSFREIVLQFKEVHGCVAKQRTNLTLLVTSSRTMRIRCTEVSSEFSDLPLDDNEDIKFYADLYQLALDTAGIKTRLLTEQMSYKLASTVTQLLERTNVISLSS
ncbi:dynein axonemal intermediate chain 7 homolog isoform X1 [Bombus terrestris]|uniref:Dynein axonemal intermediate chain 7 homolog isoform X1 n=3 Tax=Bombus terrestris TaxID=30195 RepID=A0A9B0C7Q7_BOMTE|nr:dynein axonemal intermediate chain 7 homolog isoform X1 [Bombus terrestris]XP_020720543.2 dynein axonemal intermediate chain 7 homolog isoform X1 [Bombus terrestris]XP_048264880.1 dynein axonemal intermediate chain 7 homolog isoform X1 [Bombus terrestris]